MSKEINIAELDFDTIKENLKTALKATTTFQDYNFEGAGLNILLDVLAQNTHMNAFMANMLANEMFLDSSQLRSSVISKSKELGYTPRSITAATAKVKVQILTPDTLTNIPIPKGTKFQGSNGAIFSTAREYIMTQKGISGGNNIYEADIEIAEGYLHTFSYTVDTSDIDQKFIIPSLNADISHLSVDVKPYNDTVYYSYYRNYNITTVSIGDKVYYIHQLPSYNYEVVFGDATFGKKLDNNDIVKLSYLITSGNSNNISSFSAYQTVPNPIVSNQTYSFSSVTTIEESFGGEEEEELDSIKVNAINTFEAQNRIVTEKDYETYISSAYSFIDSIKVWGGEKNDPPVFGKVFIAIKPKNIPILSDSTKDSIKENLLRNSNIVTVIPEFLDPDFIYVSLSGNTIYNKRLTNFSESQLAINIQNKIITFFSNTLKKFGDNFYYSVFTKYINDSDTSLVSSDYNFTVSKRFTPTIGITQYCSFTFNNSINSGSFISSYFNINTNKAYMKDDGNGKINLHNYILNTILVENIGTIDYNSGNINFSIYVSDLPIDTNDLIIYATPSQKDLYSLYNQIILLDEYPINNTYGRKQGITVSTSKV